MLATARPSCYISGVTTPEISGVTSGGTDDSCWGRVFAFYQVKITPNFVRLACLKTLKRNGLAYVEVEDNIKGNAGTW